jgi:hypothetical protein
MPVLRFELRQLYVPSLERFFLPLPKLSVAQRRYLAEHLKERGFETRQVGGGRLSARKGAERIIVAGSVGLAKSSTDLLDPLGPVIPRLLKFPREGPASSSLYFELKKSKRFTEIQFFPRLESLRTWTALRADGLSGLTPDEALVLRRLLEGAGDVEIDCVSTNPRDGSTPSQIFGKPYYRSRVPTREFLDSLRDIGFNPSGDTYLPRSSIIRLARAISLFDAVELGEWCYAAF